MEKEGFKRVKRTFEAASKTFYDCMEIMHNVYETSLETIKAVLSETDGNSVEFDEYEMLTVPYDGGSHPEYASNCFSRVNSVYLKNGEIYLNIEDCDEYHIERISYNDAFAIAEVLVKKRLKEQRSVNRKISLFGNII